MFTPIKYCNTPEELQAVTVSDLASSTTYQVRVVAVNDKGTSTSAWMSFHTSGYPASAPFPPTLASATINPQTPLYLLDNVNYIWNYKNQLAEVSNSASDSNYGYDYAGQRVKTAVYEGNTNQTYTTYYPNKFYEITKTAGAPDQEKKYIYAGDTLIATVKQVSPTSTPEIAYVYGDNLGSVSAVADSAGNLVQAIDYYPFGQERLCGGPGDSSCDAEKKYIGEYYDSDTALNYLNARYYNSFIGKFISQDPMFWSPEKVLSDPQSLNAYSYARNNPISLSDPNGDIVPVIALAGGLLFTVGGLASLYVYDNTRTPEDPSTPGGRSGAFITGGIEGLSMLILGANIEGAFAVGAAAGAVGNFVKQNVNIYNGIQKSGVNYKEMADEGGKEGTADAVTLGFLPEARLVELSGGAGNAKAVLEGLLCKADEDIINHISLGTLTKGVAGFWVADSYRIVAGVAFDWLSETSGSTSNSNSSPVTWNYQRYSSGTTNQIPLGGYPLNSSQSNPGQNSLSQTTWYTPNHVPSQGSWIGPGGN